MEATDDTKSDDSKQEIEDQGTKAKDNHRSLLSIAKRVSKRAGKRHEASDGLRNSVSKYIIVIWPNVLASNDSMVSRSEEMVTDERGEDGQSSVCLTEVDKQKYRRPRFGSRRHKSKSEPASRAQESLDGTNESDPAIASSGESQPLVEPALQIVRIFSHPEFEIHFNTM